MVTLLGIDAGTTSLKAALFDLKGQLLAVDRQEYQLVTPLPSRVELDAELYWHACCRAVRNVVQRSGVDPRFVQALAISSQGETLIPVDRAGAPTHPAIVWLDGRATEEAQLIAGRFEIEEAYRTTGQPEISPTWPACKILWLKRNAPEVWARTAKFLLLEDYLLYQLTGQFVTEYALQTSSLMLDIQGKTWWPPMLDCIGLSPGKLGRLVEPGTVVGPLYEGGAAAVGLSRATIAVSGALDQVAGAVGAGNVSPGTVTETTGGALAEVITLEKPTFDPQRRVPCHYHARKDTYCLLPWGQTAGMTLRWFRDQFFGVEVRRAQEDGIDVYDQMTRLAERVPAGSDGLVALPHLEGAACPEFNPAARGVFFGIDLRHTRGHFVRAIMESVAYMLRTHLDIVEELGVDATEVRSIGGGARSDLWLQIKADVLQRPVQRVAVEEAACLGAAILAGVAVGVYRDLGEATAHMVRLGRAFLPSSGLCTLYERGYQRYQELYERLEPMFGAEED